MKMSNEDKLNLLYECLQFVPVFCDVHGSEAATVKALAIFDAFKAKAEEDDDWVNCNKPIVISQLRSGNDPLDT